MRMGTGLARPPGAPIHGQRPKAWLKDIIAGKEPEPASVQVCGMSRNRPCAVSSRKIHTPGDGMDYNQPGSPESSKNST